MRLYYHPASTTSRVVQLFVEDQGIAMDYQLVDLFTGEHLQPAFAQINPNCLVPVLEDAGFRLTECSAILKYLGDKTNSPAYPKDLRERARVHEMMDWLNSNIYKDLAYGMVYPQTFPTHKRPDAAVQSATIDWAKRNTARWLKVLDQDMIGGGRRFMCGDKITLADYMGAEMIGVGGLIGCSFKAYPNIERWMGNMKALESWARVHETFDGFAASLKDQAFVAI
jgi:glutathione S-transferase